MHISQSDVFKTVRSISVALLTATILTGCGSSIMNFAKSGLSDINTKTKFSSSEYGVGASPRVTASSNVPKGGGRYQVGKPYKIAGKWYTPKEEKNYSKKGKASWYGPNFHGRKTANGEIFDQYALSAAHPTLPLPSYVRVTNLANKKSIIVRVNDRGPFAHGRVIDLSKRTAEVLDFQNQGIANVHVKYVGRAPLKGDDTRILMASLNAPSALENGNSRIRVATADTPRQPPQPKSFSSNRINLAQLSTRELSSSVANSTRQRLSDINLPSQSNSNLSSPQLGFLSNVADAGASGLFFAPTTNVNAGRLNNSFGEAADAAFSLASNTQSEVFTAQKVDINLGQFSDKETITQISLAFAVLGAVEETNLLSNGREITTLQLSSLKPGVMPVDVNELAQKFGITLIK